jgi:hypothetical protein
MPWIELIKKSTVVVWTSKLFRIPLKHIRMELK